MLRPTKKRNIEGDAKHFCTIVQKGDFAKTKGRIAKCLLSKDGERMFVTIVTNIGFAEIKGRFDKGSACRGC